MTTPDRSPLLDRPGAVGRVTRDDLDDAADGAVVDADDVSSDEAVPAHFGDPFAEQRAMTRSAGVVDRSHRGVIVVPGADRLSWLHLLLSQHVADLAPNEGTEALVLDLNGRVEHHAVLSHLVPPAGSDDVPAVWLDVEPGTAATLAGYLTKMTFWSDVAPRDASAEYAVLSVVGPDTAEVLTAAGVPVPAGDADRRPVQALPGGGLVRRMPWPGPSPDAAADLIVPRAELASWWDRLRGSGATAAGHDAFEALRVGALRPRLGHDTDDRSIPHEMGWIGSAVHLQKGCYRGQETVSRVANLGRPPRQMVLLHLASGDDALPPPGTPVLAAEGGRAVGRVGTAVRHHELGSVALALLKRSAIASASAGDRTPLWVATPDEPGPATIDPDSVPPDTGEPPGRAAVKRLRG